MMERRRFLKYSAMAATAGIITACNNPASQTPETAGALKPVKIAILTWVGYGPFFIAQDQNFFARHGLDAEILKIEDAAPRRSALARQEVQFSITTLDWFALEAAQGLPATCILKLSESYGADGIVSSKAITDVAGLRGQSVAVEKGSPSHFFLLSLLKQANLAPEDVQMQFVPTAGDAAAAFSSGQTKAAVTWEPYLSTTTAQLPNSKILVTSREKPGLLLDLLLANRDYAKNNPDAVGSVIRAWFDAVEFWKTNPEQANQSIAKGLGVSVQEVTEMVKGCRYADAAMNAAYFGLENPSSVPFVTGFTQAQEVWMAEKLIENPVNAASVKDASFLKNVIG